MQSTKEKPSSSSLLGLCRLSVFHTPGEEATYLLMGYPLLLSDCEGKILSTILHAYPEPLHACRLAEELGSSEGQISVQIHRINEKAKSISGRKLILGVSHHGFRINPYM